MASSSFACSQKHDEVFLNKVTGDFSRNSYYIVVKVGMQNKGTDYLIDNDDLFYFFHQTKGFDKSTYQKYVIPILQSRKPIFVSDTDISKFGFIKLIRNEYVHTEAVKGKDAFVKSFFKGNVLKDGISVEERNNIAQVLYDWQITTRIDDESGYLTMNK
jgi:hypothetical protein